MQPNSFFKSQQWLLDPASMYAQLHQERVTDVDGVKYLSRYEDVSAMLNHPEMSNKQVIPIGTPLRESILLHDPPDHGRIRATVGKMLNKQPIEKFRNDVTAFAHRLISDVKPEGKMDFVSQVANKMPLLSLKSLFGISERRFWNSLFTSTIGSLDERQTIPKKKFGMPNFKTYMPFRYSSEKS